MVYMHMYRLDKLFKRLTLSNLRPRCVQENCGEIDFKIYDTSEDA